MGEKKKKNKLFAFYDVEFIVHDENLNGSICSKTIHFDEWNGNYNRNKNENSTQTVSSSAYTIVSRLH